MDKIARSVAVNEVGYVGTVKRKPGWKLKDLEAWKENGNPENRSKLDWMPKELRVENRRRRKAYGESEPE